ncbi:two-component system alkaline phosphatase synthesis response regulator PhoP [Pedobacter sp. CAN_A7]|uniref:response regulator n=1 Tax=Pedobacter sp. CAN_A7 TaxID=2787722 RepID=UPI0018CB4B0A
MNKVLLIDDDLDLLEVLSSALAYFGFEVKTSNHTDDILSMVTVYQPDLVIIDYIMEGINGGEMCSAIKKKESTKNIPVIILSAYDKVIKSLGNYGCDLFISKPFDMQDLVKKIKQVISKTPVSL